MNNNQSADISKQDDVQSHPSESKPNDSSGMLYSTVVKIIDPESGQVLLHTRGE